MLESYLDGRVLVKVGDLTEENVDAVVNAANWTLLGGGGVDGAIHAKGGPSIYDECAALRKTVYPRGLPTGEAVLTTAGELAARFVIHTVGPIFGMNAGRDADLLASSYKNSLSLAASSGIRTIAFPSISTGAFHYPKHEAAAVSSTAIREFLTSDTKLTEVRLVFFSAADAAMFVKHQRFIN